jgi:hypothetical protein
VFVFDDTGSMGDKISAMKAGVTDLTDSVEDAGIDARYGLVTMKDSVEVDQEFTADAATFKSKVNDLSAAGGGDSPEDNFDAIETALGLGYRPSAQKFIIDITDATSHYPGDGSGVSDTALDQVATDLTESGTSFIAVAPSVEDPQSSKRTLSEQVDGLWIDIQNADFARILEEIIEVIASVYRITYETGLPRGKSGEVRCVVDDPNAGKGSDSSGVAIPSNDDTLRRRKLKLARTVNDQSVLSNLEEQFGVDLVGDPELAQETIENLRTAVENGDLSSSTADSIVQRLITAEDATAQLLARVGPGGLSNTNLAEAAARYVFNIGVNLLIILASIKAGAALAAVGVVGTFSLGPLTLATGAVTASLSSLVSNLLDWFITGDTTNVREEMDRGVENLIQDIQNGEIPSADGFRAAINDLIDDLVDSFRDVIRVTVEFGSQATIPHNLASTATVDTLLSSGPSVYQSINNVHEYFPPDGVSENFISNTSTTQSSVETFVTEATRMIEDSEQLLEDTTSTVSEFDSVDAALDLAYSVVSVLNSDKDPDSSIVVNLGEAVAAMLADLKDAAIGIITNTGGAAAGFVVLAEIRRAHKAIHTAVINGAEVDYEFV